MEWLQNSIVFVGSWVALVGSIVWWYAEGGYEPWIVAVLSLVGITANGHLFPFGSEKAPRLTAEQRIAVRDKWRPVFQNYFLDTARQKYRSDCIVHDVKRLDDYPKTEQSPKGISSWFRVGLMGTYERGVLLGLRWTYVVDEDGAWKEYESSKPDSAVKVMLLGEVPYESIESINFDGDEYYNKPHLFCHFEHGGEPYERLFYGEEFQLDPGFPYHYREVAEYKPSSRSRGKFWKERD